LLLLRVQIVAELGRLGLSSGRTIAVRQHKAEMERRLEGLNRETSLLRAQLKAALPPS
jgi:hypothetical protein